MINMSRNFNGFGMMPYRPQRDVPDYALNKNSGGIDQYGEYLEQTYGDPEFDQKRDDFLQTVSQQEQQTFGGGMNSFAPSITRQPSLGRPMFSGQVIGSPFGGSVGSPSANKSLPSSPYESFFSNFNVPTFFQEGGSVSGPPPTHGPNANGVSNRGMFKNRDSRKKLAQMGGILSSSPELQETAMTFANGGGADLPDYIINVPGLTAEGEYLRISSATLEKLNNAVPEVMANARMVSPVEMVISEGFSSLVANARPGDAVVGTRVNRLRAQRAASDDSLVPMPPEIAQVSSAEDVFAASNAANDARDNRVARSIAAANNEDLTSPAQLRADPLQSNDASVLAAQTGLDDKGRGTLIPSLEEALKFAGTNVPSEPPLSETERLQRQARSMTPMDMSNQDPDFANTVSKADQKRRFEGAAAAAAYSASLMAERGMLNNPLESGIAKAVPTDTDKLLEVASSILSDEQREAIASGKISDRAKALLPEQELFSETNKTGSEELMDLTAQKAGAENYLARKLNNANLASNEVVPSTANDLDDLFKKTIASQQEGTPGGSLPEDGTANYLTRESMAQAQRINVGMILPNGELASSVPYLLDRATGKAYRADGAPITAAEQGTVDKFLATEQGQSQLSAVTEADTAAKESTIASVQQKLIQAVQRNDVEGQIALRKKLKDAEKPTVKVEPPALVTGQEAGKADEAEELSAEISENEKERNRKEQDLEGATLGLGFVPPVPTAPDKSTELLTQLELAKTTGQVEPGSSPLSVTKDVQTTISDAGADAGLGQGFGGDGSIGDLTKDYVKLLKSLLGESDEDKAARKGELFMLMGAALMSGKSSNALTNIGNALQIGAKSAIQDRATRKKREDTIGLKGFEMAADRIAKRDAAQLDLDKEGRAKQAQLDLIEARLDANKDLASYREKLKLINYTSLGEHKGLKDIYDLAEDGYKDPAYDKPEEITLLELFELEARKSKYTQEQIDRFNVYYGRTGSGATDGAEGGGKRTLDDVKKTKKKGV